MWVRSPGILVTWRPPFLGEGGSCSQPHPPRGVLQPPKAPISVSLSPIKRAPTFFTSNSNKHWVTSFTLSSRHQILLNIAQQAQKNARTVTLLGVVRIGTLAKNASSEAAADKSGGREQLFSSVSNRNQIQVAGDQVRLSGETKVVQDLVSTLKLLIVILLGRRW